MISYVVIAIGKEVMPREDYQQQLIAIKKRAAFFDLQLEKSTKINEALNTLSAAPEPRQLLGNASDPVGMYIIRLKKVGYTLPIPTMYLVAQPDDQQKFQAYLFGLSADQLVNKMELFLKKSSPAAKIIFTQAFLVAKELYSVEQLEQRLINLYCHPQLLFNATTIDLIVAGIKIACYEHIQQQLTDDHRLVKAQKKIEALEEENIRLIASSELNEAGVKMAYQDKLEKKGLLKQNEKLLQELALLREQTIPPPKTGGVCSSSVLELPQLVFVISQFIHSYDLLQAQYMQQTNEQLMEANQLSPKLNFFRRFLTRTAGKEADNKFSQNKMLLPELGRIGIEQSDQFSSSLCKLSQVIQQSSDNHLLIQQVISEVNHSLAKLLQLVITNLIKLITEIAPKASNQHQYIKQKLLTSMLDHVDSILKSTLEKELQKIEIRETFDTIKFYFDDIVLEQVLLLKSLLTEHASLKIGGQPIEQYTKELEQKLESIIAVKNCSDDKFEHICQQLLKDFNSQKESMREFIKTEKSQRLGSIQGAKEGNTVTVAGAKGALGMSSFGRQLNSCEQSIVQYVNHIAQACTLLLKWYQQVCILEGHPLSAEALIQSESLNKQFIAYCTTQLANIHGDHYVDIKPETLTTADDFSKLSGQNSQAKSQASQAYTQFVATVLREIGQILKEGVESSGIKIFPEGFGSITQQNIAMWEGCIKQRAALLAEGLVAAKQEVVEQQRIRAAVTIQSLFRGYLVRKRMGEGPNVHLPGVAKPY